MEFFPLNASTFFFAELFYVFPVRRDFLSYSLFVKYRATVCISRETHTVVGMTLSVNN